MTEQSDLHLEEFRFLVTLCETRSLTAAAARHGLSMGAASRRLARLRDVFGDDLFIRSGLQLMPTSRMRSMLPRLQAVLSAADSLFASDGFDLKNTQRTVRILAVDNGVLTLLSSAVGRFYREAPHASISILPVSSRLFDAMREGEADMALFPMESVPADFHRLPLYRTRRGILVREGHPLIERYASRGAVTLDDLKAYRRIRSTFDGAPEWHRRYEAEAAAAQETAFEMPYFLAVPFVLAQTDFTYMAPVITLMHFVRIESLRLRMLPAPPEAAHFAPCLIWHQGTHADPFLQWVRAIIASAAQATAKALGAFEDEAA